jgi:hypothetical protein
MAATVTPQGRGLGRIPLFDEKSRAFPARGAAELKSVVHPMGKPVLDQLRTNGCTGNGQAHARNCKPNHKPRERYLTEDDAQRCYSRATQIDPFPGQMPEQDTGSSVLASCKAAVELNWITRYEWCFSFDHLLSSLQLGPIVVGVNWYAGFNRTSPQGYIDISGPVIGGHAFCYNGVNMRDRFLWALQSWGPGNYGLRGRFKVPFTVAARLQAEDGDAVLPIAA